MENLKNMKLKQIKEIAKKNGILLTIKENNKRRTKRKNELKDEIFQKYYAEILERKLEDEYETRLINESKKLDIAMQRDIKESEYIPNKQIIYRMRLQV